MGGAAPETAYGDDAATPDDGRGFTEIPSCSLRFVIPLNFSHSFSFSIGQKRFSSLLTSSGRRRLDLECFAPTLVTLRRATRSVQNGLDLEEVCF